MKVAIVQDWLTGLGGEVNVLEELLKVFPDADLYTSVYNEEALPQFAERGVRTTFLQNIPFAKTKHQLFGALRQFAFERLDLSDYDLVLTQTTAEAKSVKTHKDQVHICYINSEVRYYWSHYEQYRAHPGFGRLDPLVKIALPLLVPFLRKRDLLASKSPDHYISNSHEIQRRVQKYYNRGSTVIYPPVVTERFKTKPTNKQIGFIIVGRQVPYKRFDLAVAAATLADLPLTVIGRGPDHQKLRDMAGPSVRFIDNASDKELANELKKASCFVFPNLEDFGIVPVEAMAAGVPVLAYRAGGALDTVKEGVSGSFFDEQTPESLAKAMKSFKHDRFDQKKVADHAESFNAKRFRKEIREFVALKTSLSTE